MNTKYIIILLLSTPALLFGQHRIKGTFSPAGDYKTVLLYKVEPTVSQYITNAPISKNGKFEIILDSTITKGMYRITYALPQEEYNFDVLYNGKENVELKFSDETGVEFISSQENKLLESYTNSMLMITNSISNYYADTSVNKDTTALHNIFKTQRETQKGFEDAAKGTIALNFIKANKPFIPKKVIDVKTYITQLDTHYFDFVDFNNPVLQRSKFLTERMLNYVFGMSAGNEDESATYIKNIKTFNTKMKQAPTKIKKTLWTDLWEQMVDLKQETVANFIAENYLMDLAVNLNDQQLLSSLILYKDLAVGAKAPDFMIEIPQKDKKPSTKLLSSLNAHTNYVIVFWSSSCSHCLDEIPELHNFSKTLAPKQLKVIAIALENKPDKWNTLKRNFPNFLHVYGDGKWDNDIGNRYEVIATPTYFILDTNKTIVAKPEDFGDLKTYFEALTLTTQDKK